MVVPQPSTRLMNPRDTATVGEVMVIPSVTKEFGGPVGEAVMVEAVLLQRLPPEAVVTGQNITLAVEAAIRQLSHVWPPESVEYETVDEGVTVHSGPAPVAIPYCFNCDDSQTLYDDDSVLQSLG